MNRRRTARFWSAPVFWRFGNGREPTESARGLAQSKTLPRDPLVHGPNACAKAKAYLDSTVNLHCSSKNPASTTSPFTPTAGGPSMSTTA